MLNGMLVSVQDLNYIHYADASTHACMHVHAHAHEDSYLTPYNVK